MERPTIVLDAPASRHFTFRDLIECGETFAARKASLNVEPQQLESWTMLEGLARHLLDPIVDEFGKIELTYGFAPPQLTKWIAGRIKPDIDQHAACEVRRSGLLVCSRGGAAVDLRVPGTRTAAVVLWCIEHLQHLDRLYYYSGSSGQYPDGDRPFHISYHPGPSHLFYEMREHRPGAEMPRKLDKAVLRAAPKAGQ
jgi:hypothetical protein